MKLLPLGLNERDLVLLRHQIDIEWPNGTKETRDIDLVSYGDPKGTSAMAKCVSVPAAIAARMMLDGKLPLKVIPKYFSCGNSHGKN